MPNVVRRPPVSKRSRAEAMDFIAAELKRRVTEKGSGAFASTHEILGVITEEYKELIDAVQSNEQVDVEKELADIAVACVFGLASLHGELDTP